MTFLIALGVVVARDGFWAGIKWCRKAPLQIQQDIQSIDEEGLKPTLDSRLPAYRDTAINIWAKTKQSWELMQAEIEDELQARKEELKKK